MSTESRLIEASGASKHGDFVGFSTLRAYYHQQYLAKNPQGYCGIGGCGVPYKTAGLQAGEKA